MKDLWAICPFLDLTDMTQQVALDLLAQTIPVRVLLIDQGSSEESNDRMRTFVEAHHPRTLLWSYTVPLPSLSAAWNRGLAFAWSLGGEEALVCNNDLRLAPDMARLLSAVRLNTGAWFVSGVGVTEEQFAVGLPDSALGELTEQGGPDFSCFLISREGHSRYPFDEAFIPAFGEDCDAHRRYMLGGDGSRIFSVNLPFHHIGGGSRTINQSPEARARFEKQAGIGRAHYLAKWGGTPNQEMFVDPFGPVCYPHATNPELQANLQAGREVLEGVPKEGERGRELTVGEEIAEVERIFATKMAEIKAREDAAGTFDPDEEVLF